VLPVALFWDTSSAAARVRVAIVALTAAQRGENSDNGADSASGKPSCPEVCQVIL
jgi:hypothetical protein